MVVSVKDAFGVSVCILIASQLPDDDRLICKSLACINVNGCDLRLLPLEAVRIMSGFSEEVAMAVTQPLWPSIEPRKRRDSAILDERRVDFGASNAELFAKRQGVTVTATVT
jgi:hypothetical protein